MPPRPQEFRRYRQALVIGYLVLVSAICLLLLGSVGIALWSRPHVPPRGSGTIDPQKVSDLLQCNTQLSGLVDSLQGELCTVEENAGSDQQGLDRTWTVFVAGWEKRYRALGARCRFDELKNSGLGVDFDHMALVHGDLWNLHLAYDQLARSFIDRQSDEVQRIRRALDTSRKGLLARQAGAKPLLP